MSDVLPPGWINYKFENALSNISNGISDKQNKEKLGIPVTRIETISKSTIDTHKLGYVNSFPEEKRDRYRLNKGDILFSHINSDIHLGKTAIFDKDEEIYHGTNLLRLEVNKDVTTPEFIDYQCKYLRLMGIFILHAQHAVNQSSLNQKKIKSIDITLPPLPEQKLIADKLDCLLAKVDTCKARLDKVPEIIKRFRQSVLADATSGRLTEDWRGNNEHAWSIKRLNEIASHVVDCPHSTPKWATKGYLCVRTTAFKPFNLDLSKQQFVDEDTYKDRIKRLQPIEGDILYSREGTIGVACQIPKDIELCLGQRMVLIRAGEEINSKFLTIVLNSEFILSVVKKLTIGSTAPRINMKEIRAFSIPIPEMKEQLEIVNRVEELFSVADQMEEKLKRAQNGVGKLTASILAKAFQGELVRQDQNVELVE